MGTAKRERQKANRQARLQAAQEAQKKSTQRRKVFRVGGIVVAFLLVALGISVFARRDTGTDAATTTTTTTKGPTTSAFYYGTGACPTDGQVQTRVFVAAPQQCIDPAKSYVATFDTTAGTVKVQLNTTKTPGTVNNFVTLARYKYYDGTPLFRTDPSIGIIQGGGKNNSDSPGYTIPDEGKGFTYTAGDLIMARAQAPNSAGAQFFFGAGPEVSKLNDQGSYVPFGKVIGGLDVLTKILASHKADPTSELGGAPDPAVTLTSVMITEE